MEDGVWYKPVEQFILPKVGFSFLNRASPTRLRVVLRIQKKRCILEYIVFSFFPQGFEGTLVWESLDSGGLSTVNSSSVELSDGGGVLKISSVGSRAVQKVQNRTDFISLYAPQAWETAV